MQASTFPEMFPFLPCHLHDCSGNCQSGEIRVSFSTVQPIQIPVLGLSLSHHCCHMVGEVSCALFWGTYKCPGLMIEIVSTRDSAKFRAQIEVEAAGNGSHPLPKSVDSH